MIKIDMNLAFITYAANIIITSWLSITCIFLPRSAVKTIFSNSIDYSDAIRLVGCLWASILVLSVIGLFYPAQMALIFLFQAIYKTLWIVFVALPNSSAGKTYPRPMALFFLVWILIAPFAYITALSS
jgi:hypothetical protein